MASLRATVAPEIFERYVNAIRNLFQVRTVQVSTQGRVVGLASLPRQISCSGVEFLLSVGQACSKPHVAQDFTNLFALVKYAGALAPGHKLALSGSASHMDTHKKRLLSDEFGCGMALLVARHCLDSDYVMDFETAVMHQFVSTSAPLSRRPDFLVRLQGGDFALIEAKGSQSGTSYVRTKQIPSGCEQVRRVALQPAASVKSRLVVGLAIARETRNSSIILGDPPQSEPYTYRFNEDPKNLSLRLHFARTGTLIGDLSLAHSLLGIPVGPSGAGLVSREVDRRVHYGSELVVTDGSREAGVFIGLDGQLRSSLLDGDPGRRWAGIEQARDRLDMLPLQSSEPARQIVRRRDGTVALAWIPTE